MVGGVADTTSVLGKARNRRSGKDCWAQSSAGEPLVSQGYGSPNDTLSLPSMPLAEERLSGWAARRAVKKEQPKQSSLHTSSVWHRLGRVHVAPFPPASPPLTLVFLPGIPALLTTQDPLALLPSPFFRIQSELLPTPTTSSSYASDACGFYCFLLGFGAAHHTPVPTDYMMKGPLKQRPSDTALTPCAITRSKSWLIPSLFP